jgi:predicted NBD/HSP70 family sugar kinase
VTPRTRGNGHSTDDGAQPTAATPRLLRRLNAQRVLDVLRESEPLKVTELVERTGLSRPSVDAIVDELLRLGWIAEVEGLHAERPVRGRPARRLAFRADAGHVLGADIGERTVRVAVADLRGEIVVEQRARFDDDATGEERLARVRETVAATLKAAGVPRARILAGCLGCTGGIDSITGKILFSSAFPGLPDLNLAAALRRTVRAPVLVENDCNLAVLGERWHGVAQGVDDVVCVLASERLGAGIVIGGQLVRGHAGAAGEMPFLGAYAENHGAEGIAHLARTLGADAVARGDPRNGGGPTLLDLVDGDPERVDAEAVFAAARAGDPVAVDVIDEALRSAGRAVVTIALVLNPELVVIGGAVADQGELILEPMRRQLHDMARMPPRLESSGLGERIVVVGAIRRALDYVEPQLLDALHDAA